MLPWMREYDCVPSVQKTRQVNHKFFRQQDKTKRIHDFLKIIRAQLISILFSDGF